MSRLRARKTRRLSRRFIVGSFLESHLAIAETVLMLSLQTGMRCPAMWFGAVMNSSISEIYTAKHSRIPM